MPRAAPQHNAIAHPPQRPADVRPSAARRGYGHQWRKFRLWFLSRHPMCCRQGCNQPATEVNHVRRLRDNPEAHYDEAACEPLCKRHHSEYTAAHDGSFGRPKSDG